MHETRRLKDHSDDDDDRQAHAAMLDDVADAYDDKENDSYAANVHQPTSSLSSTYIAHKAHKTIKSMSKKRAHTQQAALSYQLIHARGQSVRLRRVV